MKSQITSSRRLLFVITVCLAMTAIAHADQFSPYADYRVFPASAVYGSGSGDIDRTYFGMPDLPGGDVSYKGNVNHFNLNCNPYGCTFSGEFYSGWIWFEGNSYSFQGSITSGSISGYYFFNYQESGIEDSFTFAGVWNTGFTGTGSAGFDCATNCFYGVGDIDVNTGAPFRNQAV